MVQWMRLAVIFGGPLLACLSAFAAPARDVTIYISPSGNDTWSGTLPTPNKLKTDGPVATPQRAQQLARQCGARTISLRGGTYFLPRPLLLGPEDSGVRWQAYGQETVTLSGGSPIRSPWTTADGKLYTTRLPRDFANGETVRLLRVGDDWGIRARYPNFDPQQPTKGGWLFVKPMSGSGDAFGGRVSNIHNQGDFLQWRVTVPATGDYSVFHYYAADNKPFGKTDMGGHVTFTVDDGAPVVLENLQDTGGWETFRWSARNAALHLTEGTHTIRWTNRDGGGLNYGAFALCDDPQWQPAGAPPQAPATGKHLVVVQAASFDKSQGKELTASFPASRRHFGFNPGELKAWPKSHEIEMHVFPAWSWVSTIEPVESLDLAHGVGTLAGREADQELRVGNRYYLENIAEELDAPGEWYLDQASGLLSYLPERKGFAKQEIAAPVLDRLVHIKGGSQIQFVGLTFKDTNYTPRIESAYYPPDAAVWIEDGKDCLIENCRFTRLGGSALSLVADATGNKFLGNTVAFVGQNGVFMNAPGKSAVFPQGNVIAGCTMHHLGLVYKHVAGVYIGQRDPSLAQAPGNLIAHNDIHDVPRYGVGIKMNQGNNVVEYNDIWNCNLETNDTGGIESCVRNPAAAGNIYRYNRVTDSVGMISRADGTIDSPHFTWGIYMDDDSSHAQIIGNICVRNTNGGVHIHGGRECVIENNVLVDSAEMQLAMNNIGDHMVGNVFRHNVVLRLQPGGKLIGGGGFNPKVFSLCDENLYWQTGDKPALAFPLGSLADWQKAGYDTHSVVADPQFVAPEHDDYRLQPSSPAFGLGFKAIPVEKIGVKGYHRTDY